MSSRLQSQKNIRKVDLANHHDAGLQHGQPRIAEFELRRKVM